MTSRHASTPPPCRIVAGSRRWMVAGPVLAAGIFTLVYASHKGFREALAESFSAQQGMFAGSLENAVKDHLLEEEQDLLPVVKEIRRNERGVSSAAGLLPALGATHFGDLYPPGLADGEGTVIFTTPETAEDDREPHPTVRGAIVDNRGLAAPFLSERFLDDRDRTMPFMLVPFNMKRGNLLQPAPGCLERLDERSFDDLREAVGLSGEA